MNTNSTLDFRSHPMLFRSSRLQLVPSPGFFGFTSANFQGKQTWHWENFFRPFLRIHRTTPTQVVSEPDHCTLVNGDLRLRVLFHSPDTLRIEIETPAEEVLLLGPAGEHENFGGVLEQEFLIFNGVTRCQEAAQGGIVARVNGVAAVFYSPENAIEAAGSGYRIRLRPGINTFSLAAGNEDELPALAARAREARETDCLALAQANAAWWQRRMAPLETLSEGAAKARARHAVWTMEASVFPPEGVLKRPFLGSCKTSYTKGMWLWDTCFAVRGYARFNPALCKEWLLAFAERPMKNGGFTGSLRPEDYETETQVPLFSWAANAVFDADADLKFLETACHAAKRNHDAWMACGDPRCGGLPVTQPISYDNTPLYDAFRVKGMISSEPLAIPDIIAALVNDADEIRTMAQRLNNDALENEMQERQGMLCEVAHRFLYDTDDDFYYARKGDQPIKIKSGPALTSIAFAPDEVARRLVARYLHPGSPAWPVRGIATVFADEPSYDPANFWRGPVWGPTNRLMIDALERRGFTAEADALRRETLSLFLESGDFCEVFNVETGEGSRATLMSGFGAGVFLDLLTNKR